MATLAGTARPQWTNAARAMARTGGASMASALLSMASAKILASVAGSSGVALFATLQQMRQTALVAASLNGQTALVQGTAACAPAERKLYVRTVAALFVVATSAVVLLLAAAPEWVAGLTGLGAERAGMVRWLAIPVAASSVFVFLSAMLNVSGEIGKLAFLQLVGPLVMAIFAYPVAAGFRKGNEWMLLISIGGSALASMAGACLCLSHHRSNVWAWLRASGRRFDLKWAARFLAVSLSMLATGFMGSAALLAVRRGMLHTEGLAITGRFDAAWAISMNQVTLVLSSMQTYLLPELARARTGAERSLNLSHTLLLAALVTAPVIALLAAIKPLVLTALYSAEFVEASQFLRWTLLGDYLKVASWILSVPILAAGNMKAFVAADVLAYGTFIGGAGLLSRWWPGAEAACVAFVLMYAVHLLFCGICSWRMHYARPDARSTLTWIAGLAVVAAVSIATWEVR